MTLRRSFRRSSRGRHVPEALLGICFLAALIHSRGDFRRLPETLLDSVLWLTCLAMCLLGMWMLFLLIPWVLDRLAKESGKRSVRQKPRVLPRSRWRSTASVVHSPRVHGCPVDYSSSSGGGECPPSDSDQRTSRG